MPTQEELTARIEKYRAVSEELETFVEEGGDTENARVAIVRLVEQWEREKEGNG